MHPFANHTILTCLILVVALAVSCGVGIVGSSCQTADPLMAGTWTSPNVTLNVNHTLDGNCGLLAAHGVNRIAESPWDLMVFTGSVTQSGTALVDIHLFSTKNQPQAGAIAETSTTLHRQGATLSFDLSYTIAGKAYQAPYSLTKQP